MTDPQDYLQVFLANHFDIEGFGEDPPPAVIHELDQATAQLRDELRSHGLDVFEGEVAATLAFVVSTVMELTDEAVVEHAEDCEYAGDCETSALMAHLSIEHFIAILGVMLRDTFATP